VELNEQKLYIRAQNGLKQKDYTLATEALQKLESDFPFGTYANSAQLALIYAYYKSDELPLADSAASRFIRLHPNHPDVDYAYYMRGLVAFPKPGSLFQSVFSTDTSKKNTKAAQTSFVQFSELARRFANSQYTPDALKRLEYLRNLLARSEINIANYYLERKAYIAAVNRGRYVVENHQLTPAVPDALAIMVQSYTQLGMTDLASDSLKVLSANYPGYPALNDDGSFNLKHYRKGTKSIAGLMTFGLIDTSRPPGFDSREQYGKF
jgi:outer membrane protein assembly factor BamD